MKPGDPRVDAIVFSRVRALCTMVNPWKSDRLVYRAVEHDDETFLDSIHGDAESWLNAAPWLAIPIGKKEAKESVEYLNNSALLGVVICLPGPAAAPQTQSSTAEAGGDPALGVAGKPIPIGTISLSSEPPRKQHHRHASLGINITRTYQGQGYGGEAIRSTLRWGFRFGNLHRIEIGAFEWNYGAIR